MEKTILRYSQFVCAVLVGIAVGGVQNVQAGWTGLMNGAGVGWASVNVRSSLMETSKVMSPYVLSPNASIAPGRGYIYTTNLPDSASLATYSRVKGFSGGIWQTQTAAGDGDGTDNLELEARLKITPANCASLTMDSAIDLAAFNANGHSSVIKVNATGTAGTALWLRGFEYTGDHGPLPPDDPDTVPNETIEFLKEFGTWKFEMLMEGPFDFNPTNGGCPLLIPFTLTTTNLANLIFAADGAAKTVPFAIACPSDVTFGCGQPVKYPAAQVSGGCGQITGTWSPEENYAFPIGVTPVTVTVTDENTNTTSCTFNVTITDNTPPVKPTLPDLTYGACSGVSVTPPTPTTTDNCKGVVTGTTTNSFPITALGTTVVTWTFEDGNHNVTTATQKITISGLTFLGFYNPINGIGGSCDSPLLTRSINSSLPIKFDLKCGNTKVTSGTPPIVHIQDCVLGSEIVVAPAEYQNDWHYNWSVAGRTGGTYKITVDLPDGTSRVVFVKLR